MRTPLYLLFFTLLNFLLIFQSTAKNISASELSYFEQQAKFDDKIAFQLAYTYLNGTQGVTKDITKAIFWFEKLANGYNTDGLAGKSAYVLASLYSGTNGQNKDDEKAIKYLKIAADSNVNNAAYYFAMQTKDDELHIKYLEKAALADNVSAMLQLVVAYQEHKRVKPNDNAMVKWLKKAADNDNVDAQVLIGNMYFNGDKVYQDYDRAYYYLVRAAEKRNAEAQSKLGLIHMLGLGRAINKQQAKKWFELSYQSGNKIAGENLASILLESKDNKNIKQGLNILRKVAESGSKSAAQKMISLYENSNIVKKDAQQLIYWKNIFKKNSESNSQVIGLNKADKESQIEYRASSSAVNLNVEGLKYAKEKDYEHAIKLFEQAALLNLPSAQLNLAIALIKQAQATKENSLLIKAYGWIKVASKNKQPGANVLLTDLENAFDPRTMEKGLQMYQHLKRQINDAPQ